MNASTLPKPFEHTGAHHAVALLRGVAFIKLSSFLDARAESFLLMFVNETKIKSIYA
jgi:hypothetical protein